MTTIGTLAWQVTADVSSFTSSMVLTRKEIRQSNQIMERSKSSVDKYAEGLESLRRKLLAKAIGLSEFNKEQKKLNDTLLVGQKNIKFVNDAVERGRSPADRFTAGIKKINAVMKGTDLTTKQYAAAVKQLEKELGVTTTKERQLAASVKATQLAEKEASRVLQIRKKIFNETRTSAEIYTRRIRELMLLHRRGTINANLYNRAIGRAGREFRSANPSKFAKGLQQASSQSRLLFLAMNPVIAAMAAMAATAALTAIALRAIIREGAEFEKIMSRVKALTQGTAGEMALLSDVARKLGRDTVFTATQVAQAEAEFAKAGLSVKEIALALEPTLNLAAAGQIEMKEAADIAVTSIKVFGLEIENLTAVTDVFARASSNSMTDITELGEAMKFAGPTARSAGVDFLETIAILQTLAESGIRAEQGGTAFRRTIAKMAKPSKDAQKALDQLSISFDDAQGNIRPMADVVDEFNEKLKDLGGLEKQRILTKIFELRGATAFAALMEQGGDKIREFEDASLSASGAAKTMADVQMDNLSGAFTKFNSALTDLELEIFEQFGDDLTDLVSFATDAAKGLTEFVDMLGDMNDALFDGVTPLTMMLQKLKDIRIGILEVMLIAARFVGDDAFTDSLRFQIAELSGLNDAAEDAANAIRELQEAKDATKQKPDETKLANRESVWKMVKALGEEIATLGMSSEMILRRKAALIGANQATLRQMFLMQRRIAQFNDFQKKQKQAAKDAKKAAEDRRKESQKTIDDAKAVADSVRTPFEVFRDEFLKLKNLLDKRLISEDVFAKAARVIGKRGFDAAREGIEERKPIAALEEGTAAAFSAIQANNRRGQDIEEKQLEALDELIDVTKNRSRSIVVRKVNF